MGDPSDPEKFKRPANGLTRLAEAYDVSTPTLDAIADAIVARTQLTDAKDERGAVMDLVAFIVKDVGALTALEKGGKDSCQTVSQSGWPT